MSDEIIKDENTENNELNNQQKNDDFSDDFVFATGFKLAEDTAEEIEKIDNTSRKRSRNRVGYRRRNRRLKAIAKTLSIIAAAFILATTFLLFVTEYLGLKFTEPYNVVVDIEQGASTTAISKVLKEEGAIKSSLMFRVFCKLAGYDGKFKYGVYTFPNEYGYKDIAELLQSNGEANNSVKVTIPERSSIDDIMSILAKKGVCTKADFKNALNNGNYSDIAFVDEIPEERVYYRFEGYLFPDTYQFYNFDSAECAELAIRKMLKRTEEVLTNDMLRQIEKDNKTVHDVLTMASIVELEASASLEEMPKVAAVFYNRLVWDEPQRLGSSPTAEYPYGGGRYDTNNVEGLPPGPLCSPSEAAIKAAVYPEKNFHYTYFVTDSDMKFYYNESYEQHNQTIANLKNQGKWIG